MGLGMLQMPRGLASCHQLGGTTSLPHSTAFHPGQASPPTGGMKLPSHNGVYSKGPVFLYTLSITLFYFSAISAGWQETHSQPFLQPLL